MATRPDDTTKRLSRNYIFTIWIGATVLIASILLVSLFALYQLRTYALDQASLVAKNLATSVDQTFDSLIGAVHNSLFAVGDELTRQLATGRPDATSINVYFQRQTKRVPYVSSIHATNELGDIVYGPTLRQPPINIADRNYFVSLKNDTNNTLLVSKAIFSRVGQEWVWLFGSRFNHADGSFAGIVVAELKLSDLDRMLETIQLGGAVGNVIAVRDEELLLVTRNAVGAKNTVPPGVKGMSDDLTRALKIDRNSGNYIGGLTSVDGIERVYFYNRNPTYGFLAIVGISVVSALADWQHEAWVFFWFVLGAVLLVCAFAHHLIKAFNRQATDLAQLAAEQNLSHTLEFYDPLTQLPNRHMLMDRLVQAIASSRRSGKGGAVLLIDLDNFKVLNDSKGLEQGDLLLKQAAQRIQRCVQEGDTVARVGGDEFVVILEDLVDHPAEVATQAEQLGNKILMELGQPYRLGEHAYTGSGSIGVTLFNKHDQSAEQLLKQADIAMYQAKQAGRNCVRFLDPVIQAEIAERATLETELRNAIEGEQFQLYYQIQVDQVGLPSGAEALIRWLHPEKGIIGPLQFIALAEETGLILPIGDWVLETACSQIRKWQDGPTTRDLVISVNVSAKQFIQSDFVERVQTTLVRHSIQANRLEIELTESLFLNNISDAIKTMSALKQLGVRFSLDDFGTGYSSLQYLKLLPLDQLKIDQSFVKDVVLDHNDKVIVETIIAMANALDLGVIAEGVETSQQKQFLIDHGCMHLQGYLFGKPVPIADFETLLASH